MVVASRTAASTLIGGTAAAITGGDFINGAKTAAYGEMYNGLSHVWSNMVTGAVAGTMIGGTMGGEGGATIGTIAEPGGGTLIGGGIGGFFGAIGGAIYGAGSAAATDMSALFNNAADGTPRQAQRKNKRGQGPREVKRIDEPHDYPEAQWHAHGENGGAINQDGTIHDSDPGFGRKTLDWLRGHGWGVR